MLYWQQRRIDQLIAQQIKITDELLALKGIMAANGYHVPPALPHSPLQIILTSPDTPRGSIGNPPVRCDYRQAGQVCSTEGHH